MEHKPDHEYFFIRFKDLQKKFSNCCGQVLIEPENPDINLYWVDLFNPRIDETKFNYYKDHSYLKNIDIFTKSPEERRSFLMTEMRRTESVCSKLTNLVDSCEEFELAVHQLAPIKPYIYKEKEYYEWHTVLPIQYKNIAMKMLASLDIYLDELKVLKTQKRAIDEVLDVKINTETVSNNKEAIKYLLLPEVKQVLSPYLDHDKLVISYFVKRIKDRLKNEHSIKTTYFDYSEMTGLSDKKLRDNAYKAEKNNQNVSNMAIKSIESKIDTITETLVNAIQEK